MWRFGLTAAFLAAKGASAEPLDIRSGCEATATVIRANCEILVVLACEGSLSTHVDVYRDGVFLGEESYDGTAMVRWRRGTMVQELAVTDGDFDAMRMMPEADLRTVTVDRLRRQTGTDTAAMKDSFAYEISVVGPSVRELASGKTREVRQFRVVVQGEGTEASDLVIDYDQALRLPIWREGIVTAPNGTGQSISIGMADVLMPGDTGHLEATPPDGAACTPG